MLLVIDSATTACSIALADGTRLIAESHEVVGRGHAERLIPMVEALLDGRRPTAILVDCGPGSFTGVRVGLSAAHGMAIGWNVPLTGYSSLAAIAAMAGSNVSVGIAVHGGHGQLFVQSYGHDPFAPLDELQSLTPEAAASAVTAPLVLGSAADMLVAVRGYGEARETLPRASSALHLPDALRSLEPRPLYGRAPDAKPMAVQ